MGRFSICHGISQFKGFMVTLFQTVTCFFFFTKNMFITTTTIFKCILDV